MVRTLTNTTCANLFFASYEALWMCGRTLCRKHEFSISYYCTYAERNTLRFAHGKGKNVCTARFHWQDKMHLSVANVKNRNISITHAWKKHESPRSHTQAKWQRTREICIYVVEQNSTREGYGSKRKYSQELFQLTFKRRFKVQGTHTHISACAMLWLNTHRWSELAWSENCSSTSTKESGTASCRRPGPAKNIKWQQRPYNVFANNTGQNTRNKQQVHYKSPFAKQRN
jgi:hypothetical protein